MQIENSQFATTLVASSLLKAASCLLKRASYLLKFAPWCLKGASCFLKEHIAEAEQCLLVEFDSQNIEPYII
jgi:hypothetical protein